MRYVQASGFNSSGTSKCIFQLSEVKQEITTLVVDKFTKAFGLKCPLFFMRSNPVAVSSVVDWMPYERLYFAQTLVGVIEPFWSS